MEYALRVPSLCAGPGSLESSLAKLKMATVMNLKYFELAVFFLLTGIETYFIGAKYMFSW